MPRVGGGNSFTDKLVTQMAAAVGAIDLRSHTVGVGQPVYGPCYFLIE